MIRIVTLAGVLLAGLNVLAADDPPADPKKDMIDVGKTTERIVQNANEAGKRLGAKDPGEDTRKIQQKILKDIDALIRKAQEPPPEQKDPKDSEQGGMNQSGGQGGMKKMNEGMAKQSSGVNTSSTGGPPSRKERRERARQNGSNSDLTQQPQPMSDPFRSEPRTGMGPKDSPVNRIETKSAPPRVADVYKEIWGHLPEKMRQEMDLYFRDQFMPRYSDLLRQYYSSLAEREDKSRP